MTNSVNSNLSPEEENADGRPTLMCSYGSMMRQAMFQPQLDGLADCCPMVAYDNLTWADPDKRVSLGDLVEDCRAQMDARGVDAVSCWECLWAGIWRWSSH